MGCYFNNYIHYNDVYEICAVGNVYKASENLFLSEDQELHITHAEVALVYFSETPKYFLCFQRNVEA